MTDLAAFAAMLERAHIEFSSSTDFDKEYAATGAVTRLTVYGGSSMHAEADFDADGRMVDLGRLEHY